MDCTFDDRPVEIGMCSDPRYNLYMDVHEITISHRTFLSLQAGQALEDIFRLMGAFSPSLVVLAAPPPSCGYLSLAQTWRTTSEMSGF